jgi:hypothetical protein
MKDKLTMKINGADSVIKALEPKGQSVVFIRSLNKAITSVRAEGRRAIRERYTIKAKDAELSVTKAGRNSLQAKVSGSYNPLSLVKFKAKKTGTGVRVEVLKGKPVIIKRGIMEQPKGRDWRKFGQSRQVNSPVDMIFVKDKRKRSPFARKRKRDYGNYPLRKLTGPSVGAMLRDDDVVARMQSRGYEQLEKNLIHELEYYLKSIK